MKLISEIKQLIKEANKTSDINRLIEINMRISGFLIYVAEKESDALRNKLAAYNERKEFEADFCLRSTEGITKAEKAAVVASQKHRIEEMETEVVYNRIRGFRTQVSEFCQALMQKIAALRREEMTSKQQV